MLILFSVYQGWTNFECVAAPARIGSFLGEYLMGHFSQFRGLAHDIITTGGNENKKRGTTVVQCMQRGSTVISTEALCHTLRITVRPIVPLLLRRDVRDLCLKSDQGSKSPIVQVVITPTVSSIPSRRVQGYARLGGLYPIFP